MIKFEELIESINNAFDQHTIIYHSDIIYENLFLFEIEIKKIFEEIKFSDSFDVAEKYFSLLDEIQFILAKLFYKEKFKIPESLLKFIADFDRMDLIDERKYFFN